MDPTADILRRLEAGERIRVADVSGPVLADLAAAGWSTHLLTGELIWGAAAAAEDKTDD